MSDYRAAVGTDVALGSLTTLNPQPTTDGIKSSRRTYSADGAIVDEGKYIELVWSILKNPTMYQAILTVFGILNDLTADVTVYARDETFNYVRMNGIAVRPQPGAEVRWSNSFPRQVTILVKNLEEAA